MFPRPTPEIAQHHCHPEINTNGPRLFPQMPKIWRHLPWWTYGGYLDPKSTRPQKGMRAAQTTHWWQAAPAPPNPSSQSGCTPAEPSSQLREQSPGLSSFPRQLSAPPTAAAGLSVLPSAALAPGLAPERTDLTPPRALKAWLPNPSIKNS